MKCVKVEGQTLNKQSEHRQVKFKKWVVRWEARAETIQCAGIVGGKSFEDSAPDPVEVFLEKEGIKLTTFQINTIKILVTCNSRSDGI